MTDQRLANLTNSNDRGLLWAILETVVELQDQQRKIMSTLQDILAGEGAEKTALGQLATAVQSLQAGVATLQTELAAALAGTTLPPAVQAQVDAAFAASKANGDAVNAILASLAPVPPPAGP